MLFNCIAVFIGGGFGSLLRFLVSVLTKKFFIISILGTFIVNVIGCFIMGFVFAFTMNKTEVLPQTIKILITVGFLGGLTTFSTLNIEIFELIKCGKIINAILYLGASCILGLFATYLGYNLYYLYK